MEEGAIQMVLRAIAGLIGALFLVQTARWMIDPAAAARSLGMPLLDGMARSTQVGDFTSFFLAMGSMAILGAIRSNGTWLRASAMLLGGAAAMRTLAWAIHDADFALQFIAIESITAMLLLAIAYRFDSAATDPSSNELH
jgi:hypothetical protein